MLTAGEQSSFFGQLGSVGIASKMSELYHECGVAAIYYLPGGEDSDLCPGGPNDAPRLLVRMLLDIQNRGQLSAGITTFRPTRDGGSPCPSGNKKIVLVTA